MICSGTFPVSGFLFNFNGEQKMKKKRMVLVMAVSAMCMMAGCGNTVKDGTEALEQGDYDTAIASLKRQQEVMIKKKQQKDIVDLE